MQFQAFASCVLCMFLCAANGASLKGRERRGSADSLQQAVNNAFDALVDVQEAIPNDNKDVYDKIEHDEVSMDKETAKKFVREIDELEDMIMDKQNNDDIIKSKELVKKEDGMSSEKQTTITSNKKESAISEEADKKDIDETFDFLVDILKSSIRERKRNTRFEDYWRSTLKKEKDRELKRNKNENISLKSKNDDQYENKEQKMKKSMNDKTDNQTENQKGKEKKSLNAKNDNQSENEKQTEKKTVKKNSEHSNGSVSEKSEEQKTAEKDGEKLKHPNHVSKITALKKNHIHAKSKVHVKATNAQPTKHITTAKQHSSHNVYEREIKNLVEVILKRRDEEKREKLKLALGDIFHILEGKRSYAQKKDTNTGRSNERYENMILGKLFD